jgi:hypothetical protein
MQQITPEEATRIAYLAHIDHSSIFAIFDNAYTARHIDDGLRSNTSWSVRCAADACYVAGRIDGIRAERERRRKAHSRTARGGQA